MASAQKNITKEIETYEQKNRMILDKLDDISHTIDILNDSLKQAERSYDLIRSQEPSLMWFQKIFNKSKVEQYFEDLNRANSVLNDLVDKKVLPEMLDDACWVVRQLGNSAAHGDQTDFYRYEVERATEFVGALIDYIYVLPNRIARFKQKVEEKLKEKTENQN